MARWNWICPWCGARSGNFNKYSQMCQSSGAHWREYHPGKTYFCGLGRRGRPSPQLTPSPAVLHPRRRKQYVAVRPAPGLRQLRRVH